MKKICLYVLLIVGGVAAFSGCANRLAPIWYKKLAQDPKTLMVRYRAESDSLQLAIKLAEDGARRQLTEAVGQHIRDLRFELEQEIKLSEQQDLLDFFNKRVKAVVTANLFKINVRKQQTVNHEGTWHTFIIMEYPLAEANKALVDEFKRHAEMYEQIHLAQAFVALEKQVELGTAGKN